jgi:tRNA-dihydrouridine synthase B
MYHRRHGGHNRTRMSDHVLLTDPWRLGSLEVPNRVMLAPLAGIGNWFVRLQAKRYGAGMTVSEMVSSHAIHYRNARTCTEMLSIHPDERGSWSGRRAAWDGRASGDGRAAGDGRAPGQERGASWSEPFSGASTPGGGPVSIQLFGEDPAIMRSAAAHLAAHTDADAIDINMGCPVPKVRRTGAGAGMLANPALAIVIARAAREGALEGGRELPVTVKLRSGLVPGDTAGYELAHRLVAEAGAAAIGFHPRSAAVHHKGAPDYALAARLVQELDAPVILTGGLHDAPSTLAAFEQTGATAVMLARGALGNPWLFAQLLGARDPDDMPTRVEVLGELDWTIDRAVEHLGEARATRYLRKFYPWYVTRLDIDSALAKRLNEALLRADTLSAARGLLETYAPRYTGALAEPIQPAVPA